MQEANGGHGRTNARGDSNGFGANARVAGGTGRSAAMQHPYWGQRAFGAELVIRGMGERSRPRPFDPSVLSSKTLQADDLEAENPCPICLAPLIEETVSSGPCQHMYHRTCLVAWVAKQPVCPVW